MIRSIRNPRIGLIGLLRGACLIIIIGLFFGVCSGILKVLLLCWCLGLRRNASFKRTIRLISQLLLYHLSCHI